jgi:hypothetical protein
MPASIRTVSLPKSRKVVLSMDHGVERGRDQEGFPSLPTLVRSLRKPMADAVQDKKKVNSDSCYDECGPERAQSALALAGIGIDERARHACN